MITLSKPDITDFEIQAVVNVLKTPNLSLGPKIPEFERIVAEYAGVKYAVAMSSGTSVLHCIIKSLELEKGDIFLTTSFSFISTTNCLLYEGLEPYFVDIDEGTYNLNPKNVEEIYLSLKKDIREKVKGIIYIDTFGVPAEGIGFEELAKKYKLYLIEDSAEALGSGYRDRKCGSFGDAGLFAFYPNKQITTGEGGILVTNNEKISKLARSFRNQGRDEDAGWLQHSRLGYNYRMSDINAVLGIVQMSRIEEIIKKRKSVKNVYDEYFKDLYDEGILIPQLSLKYSKVNPFVFVLRLNDEYNFNSREEILKSLRKNNIQCSNYFTPIHLQPHISKIVREEIDLPVTENISKRTIALPYYNNLEVKKIEYVYLTLKNILKGIK